MSSELLIPSSPESMEIDQDNSYNPHLYPRDMPNAQYRDPSSPIYSPDQYFHFSEPVQSPVISPREDRKHHNHPINFQDELALNMSSLALNWKPINPDLQLSLPNSKLIHPIFQLPRAPFNSISSRKRDFPSTSSSNSISKKNNDNPPTKGQKRFQPYSRTSKDKPVKTKNQYKYIDGSNIPTSKIKLTKNPEEKSKYLDPSLSTKKFWEFVGKRSEARTLEIREAWKNLMEGNSNSNSYCGSSYGASGSRFDVNKEVEKNSNYDDCQSSEERKTLYSDFITSPKTYKNPGQISLKGVELISKKSKDTSSSSSLINRITNPKSVHHSRRRFKRLLYDNDKDERKILEAKHKREKRNRV